MRRPVSTGWRSSLASLVCLLSACWSLDATARDGDPTLLDLRYQGVVRQTTEYSCGAAALACLLSLYFGVAATESEVLDLVEAQVTARGEEPGPGTGLTAYDLKKASSTLGLQLVGYELSVEQVEEYFACGGFPMIAHVTKPCSHYLVVVGMRDETLLLSDPGWGRYAASATELRDGRAMSGVFLVALPSEEQARSARAEQTRALGWMCSRVSQLSDLRETIIP